MPRGDGTHLLQETLDAAGILGTEDVPQGTRAAASILEPLLQGSVHILGLQEHGCRKGGAQG